MTLKNLELDQYLKLAYDQDDAALIQDEEYDKEDLRIGDYEKAKREFTDEELGALNLALSGLFTYEPFLRYTPEALLYSPWFKESHGR